MLAYSSLAVEAAVTLLWSPLAIAREAAATILLGGLQQPTTGGISQVFWLNNLRDAACSWYIQKCRFIKKKPARDAKCRFIKAIHLNRFYTGAGGCTIATSRVCCSKSYFIVLPSIGPRRRAGRSRLCLLAISFPFCRAVGTRSICNVSGL